MAKRVRYGLPPLDMEVLERITALASESSDPEFLNLACAVSRLAQRSDKLEALLAIVMEIVGEHVTVEQLKYHGLLGDEPDRRTR